MTGGKAVRVVNTVGLEQYLWGVVPSEMPDTWPAEALKSQAIVARTYALTHLQNGGGDFDVYPDTRSQVYGGISAESDPARDAVNGTAGQVVLYKGELAQTFFFSSSGGRTANVQDVWSSKPTPYLVSVPDPYDTLSPYHDWGPLKFGALRLGKRLGSRGTLLDVQHRRRRGRPRPLADSDRLEGQPHDQRLERARRARAPLDVVHDRDAQPHARPPSRSSTAPRLASSGSRAGSRA